MWVHFIGVHTQKDNGLITACCTIPCAHMPASPPSALEALLSAAQGLCTTATLPYTTQHYLVETTAAMPSRGHCPLLVVHSLPTPEEVYACPHRLQHQQRKTRPMYQEHPTPYHRPGCIKRQQLQVQWMPRSSGAAVRQSSSSGACHAGQPATLPRCKACTAHCRGSTVALLQT